MAPNKSDLINKVRRMRDAIDGGSAAIATTSGVKANYNNSSHLRYPDLKAPAKVGSSSEMMRASDVGMRNNNNETRQVNNQQGKQGHILKQQQQQRVGGSNQNYNIPRKERAPKRIIPIEETEEEQAMGLGPLPAPPLAPAIGQAQLPCTSAKALFCGGGPNQLNHHHHHDHITRIKPRETTHCKRLEANLKETQHNMGGQPHTHSTGADCNGAGRLAGGGPNKPDPLDHPATILSNHNHHHHHQLRQHCGPVCPQASNLLVNDDSTHQNSTKHHQPHCVYYQQSNKQQRQYLDRLAEPGHSMPDMVMTDTRCKLQQHHRSSKYLRSHPNQQQQQQQQDKYLLVEYRPSRTTELHATNNNNNRSCHSFESTSGIKLDTSGSSSGGGGGSKRTTIKFISQLYFLLHLSAILSLLFYHKNLVTSESKWPDDAQQFYSSPTTGAGGHLHNHHHHHQVKVHIVQNDTSNSPTTPTTPIILNPLPVPQMLKHHDHDHRHQLAYDNDYNNHNIHQHHHPHKVVGSVVIAPNYGHGIRLANSNNNNYNVNVNGSRRFGRQTVAPSLAIAASPRHQQQSQHLFNHQHLTNPDILVRLVGPQHARHVLRYFLSYLLITSVFVLICLRLFMLCNWRQAKRKFASPSNSSLLERPVGVVDDDARRPQQETESQIYYYGFYHRTRLDCTPVLIGSISLGLIQLIVIGLDIAYNFDYLSENRWPANNLPFLQFAFVSLLMQYILGKVAEKREQRKSIGGCSNGSSANSRMTKTRAVGGEDVGSGSGLKLDNKRVFPISNSTRHGHNNSNDPSTGGGLENIALAHLLVTHILLWLMKLNSISLFQATIELQQHQNPQNHYLNHHHGIHGRQRQQQQPYSPFQRHHDQQSISNKLYPSIEPPTIVSDPQPSSPTDPPTYPTSGGDLLLLKNVPLTATNRGDRDILATNGRNVPRNENRPPPLSPSMGLPPVTPIRRQPAPVESSISTSKPRGNSIHTNTIPYNSDTTNPRHQPPPPPPPLLSNLSHRPPPPPIAMLPPDEPTTTTLTPNEPTPTAAPTQPPPEPEVAQPDPFQGNKGERGLRSAGGQLDRSASSSFGANTKASEAGNRSNSRWAQHLPRGLNVTHPTTTTTSTTTTSRAPELPAAQPSDTNLAGLLAPKAKSSLPKRMTAFRQRPPSSATVAGSSIVASISQVATAAAADSSTTTTTSTTTTSTTPAPPARPSPKQRVRVMIQRVEDPIHLEAPELDAARGRRAKQVAAAASATTTTSRPTSMRPFPSVESDPPILASTTPSSMPTTFRSSTTMKASKGIRSLAGNREDRKTQPPSSYSSTTSPPNKTMPIFMPEPSSNPPSLPPSDVIEDLAEDEDDKIGSYGDTMRAGGRIKGATEEESSAGAGSNTDEDDSEESDIDLDALLPPVPNYTEETPASAIDAASEDIVVKKPPTKAATGTSRPRSGGNSRVSADTAGGSNGTTQMDSRKKAFDLREDAFVFNEAASEISNATADLLWPDQLNSLRPTHEALVMPQRYQQQHKPDENTGEPTFADYLMPIVHQYHILIVAILFNMWLDGLRGSGSSAPTSSCAAATKPPQATYAHQDVSFSNKRLLTSRDLLLATESCTSGTSGSELGGCRTVSRSSSPGGGGGGLAARPIRDKHGHFRQHTSLQDLHALNPRLHESSAGGHWKHHKSHNGQHHNHYQHKHQLNSRHRSHSMESLAHPDDILASSSESTLSGHQSMRSTSSKQLLWVSGVRAGARARSPLLGRQVLAPFSLRQTTDGGHPAKSHQRQHQHQVNKSERHHRQQQLESLAAAAASRNSTQAPNSVCSVFFGLIIVSLSLIVILVSIDLLSIATQCLTQLITIIVCLVGLLLIWRSNLRRSSERNYNENPKKRRDKKKADSRFCYKNRLLYLTTSSKVAPRPQPQPPPTPTGSHRQCFHYLFLLAAYYCGISIALNLGKQHSMQQLFSPQVIQFIQRHFGQNSSNKFTLDQMPTGNSHRLQPSEFNLAAPITLANYLFLFHLIVAVKGLLLILQVTLQTVMIRSSCQRATKELRQIYTFLMFANLSLWALEICEQQQHLQRETLELAADQTVALPGLPATAGDRLKSSGLDGFNRFAASIVTLSHLYHGLVFMQQ